MPFLPLISMSDLSVSPVMLPLHFSFLHLCCWHPYPSLQSPSFLDPLHQPPNSLPVGTFAFLYTIPHTAAKVAFYRCNQILFFSTANPLKVSFPLNSEENPILLLAHTAQCDLISIHQSVLGQINIPLPTVLWECWPAFILTFKQQTFVCLNFMFPTLAGTSSWCATNHHMTAPSCQPTVSVNVS